MFDQWHIEVDQKTKPLSVNVSVQLGYQELSTKATKIHEENKKMLFENFVILRVLSGSKSLI